MTHIPFDAKWTGTAYVSCLNPHPATIHLEDIAAGLARTCRWGGHCDRFYSVAQHSLHCLRLAREMKLSRAEQKSALMHDAAEAYLGDMPSPYKSCLPDYQAMEDRFTAVIAKRFQLPRVLTPAVKKIDLIAMATEKRDLMKSCPDEWAILDGITPHPDRIRTGGKTWVATHFLNAANAMGIT